MKKLLLITANVFLIQITYSQTNNYFGQTPPGDEAVIFAPGIISLTNRYENRISFSPDGSEVYFSADYIYCTKYENGVWTNQVKVSIFDGYDNPVFSVNGEKIYLTKYINIGTTNLNSDIWMSNRTTEGWSAPQRLSAPINSTYRDDVCTETVDSTKYVNSNRSGSMGIWCIRSSSVEAENLVSIGDASDPCISSDGSYLIFSSDRSGGYGIGDLYISFNEGNNEWTAPINMNYSGSEINLANYNQISPSLSPDGKFLFFNRHSFPDAMPDIYWVSTHIIDTLKKIAIPTGFVQKTIEGNVNIYPNTSSGQFSISFGSNPINEALVTIFNLQGTQVFSKTFHNKPSATIDLTGNPAGIYVVKAFADGVCFEEKILKE